ncbi:hypothetical protein M885DRAFT_620871 [Pelagophyceae sp. CCMP2097]|nr:hypothetical protein M885DRAFT_620871 [Pelagophyceae sp. CCMP2097]
MEEPPGHNSNERAVQRLVDRVKQVRPALTRLYDNQAAATKDIAQSLSKGDEVKWAAMVQAVKDAKDKELCAPPEGAVVPLNDDFPPDKTGFLCFWYKAATTVYSDAEELAGLNGRLTEALQSAMFILAVRAMKPNANVDDGLVCTRDLIQILLDVADFAEKVKAKQSRIDKCSVAKGYKYLTLTCGCAGKDDDIVPAASSTGNPK